MQRESTSGQNASAGQERQQGGQERQQQAEQSYAGQQGGSNQQQGTQTRGSQGEMATRGGSQGQGVQVGQRGGMSSPQQQSSGRGVQRYSRDPLSLVQQLSEEMDQLFDAFFYGRPMMPARSRRSELQTLWAPELEVREEGNQLRICVDLPGVSKDNVKVDIEDGALTIQGERTEERQEGGAQQGFHRSERRYGSFYRSIALPEGTDSSQAKASMKDGVLEIVLPIEQRKQAQRLEIQG